MYEDYEDYQAEFRDDSDAYEHFSESYFTSCSYDEDGYPEPYDDSDAYEQGCYLSSE